MGGGMSCERMDGGMKPPAEMSPAQEHVVECRARKEMADTAYWAARDAANAEIDAAVVAEKAKHGG